MAKKDTMVPLPFLSSTSARNSSILYWQGLEALGFIDCMFSSRKRAHQSSPVAPSFAGGICSQLMGIRLVGANVEVGGKETVCTGCSDCKRLGEYCMGAGLETTAGVAPVSFVGFELSTVPALALLQPFLLPVHSLSR